jgi:16S rRNA (cytidine1402-2'-O)-methyltransferase
MLYIISTPIGNLKDITLRAIDTLEQLDILLCEDTRKTGLLLNSLKIANKPKLISFYDEVEQQKVPQIIEMLKEGLEVGLVSDAGTPLISDPGWLLVKRCHDLGIKYTAIGGISAVINALVLSGLPVARFCFLGFMPKKDGDVKKIINKYKDFDGTKVLYESPLRAKKTITLIKEICGEKTEIRIIREMTKIYESVDTEFGGNTRGEVVILFG